MAPGGGVETQKKMLNFDKLVIGEEKTSVSAKPKIGWKDMQGISSINGVQELLHCPVCRNLMYPPIHQCPNGHTLCVNCKIRAHNSCPTCQFKLGEIRCLALERVAAAWELPCRYKDIGCFEIFPYYSKLKHEQNCQFRPYDCPYAGSECNVTGDIPLLVDHLKDDHKVDMHYGCTFNHRYVKSNPHEVDNAAWMLTVFSCFGSHFCLHFEAFQLKTAPVYMAFLRFMGEDIDARKFSYTLEVGGNGRKWYGKVFQEAFGIVTRKFVKVKTD